MKLFNYVMLFMLPLIFIFSYGKYRCSNPKFKDPLESNLFLGLDLWSATHFLFFMTVGYIYPKTLILSTAFGISWELFEHISGKNRPGWLGGYGDCKGMASDKSADGNWWYGKWSDIVLNILGFLLGRYIRTKKIM